MEDRGQIHKGNIKMYINLSFSNNENIETMAKGLKQIICTELILG